MPHSIFAPNNVAVITGGASGIGLAASKHCAAQGMSVVVVDLGAAKLAEAEAALAKLSPRGAEAIVTSPTDVGDFAALQTLAREIEARFGGVDLLMNNAGIQISTTALGPRDNWERLITVNLMGIVNGTQAFAPAMIKRGRSGVIVNTGSKQGITTPPGNPAYNVSKAGVKAFTEALQHELRNTDGCKISAHLLIPGFVYTPLTQGTRSEKPAAAWTPEETIAFMVASLERGDFYILCPDNDVPRALDEKRMAWAIGDIIENRPPLSRWHKDYEAPFKWFAEGR